jgi:hypothetical protein
MEAGQQLLDIKLKVNQKAVYKIIITIVERINTKIGCIKQGVNSL